MGRGRQRFRVVLVDDHPLFREAFEVALTIEGYDVRVVQLPPEGLPASELLERISELRPRLVLLDLDLGPSGDGVALVRPLATAGVDVVVLTGTLDRSRWGEAVHHGARKVIGKGAALRQSLAVVRRLQQGQAVTTVEEREELVQLFRQHRAHHHDVVGRIGLLTDREAQVLTQLMLGRTVREIASDRSVAEATVRTQVKAVLSKLGVSSQIAAVGLARQIGWAAPAR